MTTDMRQAIIPKSDQLNADDLITGEMTIKISGVTVKGGQEQPVAIHFDGDKGKPYKPCKSMCRVMVSAWGADSSKYVGRSMTLYCDPKVKWAGMEVGGIRISHMSGIEETLTMALTVTRANKKPYTVRPLKIAAPTPATLHASETATSSEPLAAGAAPYVTDEQALALEAKCTENGIAVTALKKAAGVERLAMIKAEDYDRAVTWLDKKIAMRKDAL